MVNLQKCLLSNCKLHFGSLFKTATANSTSLPDNDGEICSILQKPQDTFNDKKLPTSNANIFLILAFCNVHGNYLFVKVM